MPPTIARKRSLRIGVSLLLLRLGLQGLILVEPMQCGPQVVDDQAGCRLGNRPGHGATASLGDDEDATTVEADLDPGDLAARPNVRRSREQLGGDPGQLLSALRRAGACKHEARAAEDRHVDDLRRERQQLGKCVVWLHRGRSYQLAPASSSAARDAAARARCELAVFQPSPSSATVLVSPSGTKIGSYPKPSAPRRSDAIVPASVPSATTSSPAGPIATI